MENGTEEERLAQDRLEKTIARNVGRAPIRGRWLGLVVAAVTVLVVWSLLAAFGLRFFARDMPARARAIKRARADLDRLARVVAPRCAEELERLPEDQKGMLPVVLLGEHGCDTRVRDGREVCVDPWGEPYIFAMQRSRATFHCYSSGPNRVDERGRGDDLVARGSTSGINREPSPQPQRTEKGPGK